MKRGFSVSIYVARRLRFIPEERTLVEVTCRTVHGRYLLRPSPLLDEIIIGALARALGRYGARCIAFAFVSSHYHLLLEVDSAFQLSRVMGHFNSKMAREVGRLTGWREKIWSRRYPGDRRQPRGRSPDWEAEVRPQSRGQREPGRAPTGMAGRACCPGAPRR